MIDYKNKYRMIVTSHIYMLIKPILYLALFVYMIIRILQGFMNHRIFWIILFSLGVIIEIKNLVLAIKSYRNDK